jgi:hypothetical protein
MNRLHLAYSYASIGVWGTYQNDTDRQKSKPDSPINMLLLLIRICRLRCKGSIVLRLNKLGYLNRKLSIRLMDISKTGRVLLLRIYIRWPSR